MSSGAIRTSGDCSISYFTTIVRKDRRDRTAEDRPVRPPDTDPRERARIQASLDALGEPTADDRSGKQEVRALLIRQLGVFREMELRQVEVSERRQRVLEHLRMLGLQVAQLQAHAATSPDSAAEITGRIRTLCRGADARIDGLAIVDTILETDRASR